MTTAMKREPRYGVFLWQADGRYHVSQAVHLDYSEKLAQRKADRWNEASTAPLSAAGYVVRTLAWCQS